MIKKNINEAIDNLHQNKFILFALTVLLVISHYMVLGEVGWPKRYFCSGSTRTLPLIASRPKSILNPIESRLVNVISIGQEELPI